MPLLDMKLLIAGIIIGGLAIALSFYSVITKLSLAREENATLNIRPYSCRSINIKWFGPVHIDAVSSSIIEIEVHDNAGRLMIAKECNGNCTISTRGVSYVTICNKGINNITVKLVVRMYRLVMPNAFLAVPALALGLLAVLLMMLSLRGLRRHI